jgi:MFS transporter, OFA family, oxalate/formate antiporter
MSLGVLLLGEDGMFRRVFYGWWIVLACFLISLYVGGVTFFGMTAFFQPISQELGWSYTQISLASSLRGLEMGIFAPLVGILVDRFGSRSLMLLGTITLGMGLIVLSWTQSLLAFYGAFLLIGFGAGGCASVVTTTAVAQWFRRNVGIAMGVMASGFGAGGLIVPLIVELINRYGWRSTLTILAVGMWCLGTPLSLVMRERPEKYGYLPDGDAPGTPAPDSKTGLRSADTPEFSVREALRNRAFLFVNLSEAIRLLCVTAVVLHVMPYLENAGFSRAVAGMVAASLPVVSILGRVGLGRLGDRFEKRHVLAGCFLIMSMGLVAFCLVELKVLLLVFLLLFCPGFGGGMVLRGAILREHFGRESFGKLMGLVMGSASLGGIIGPTLAGWTFDTLGSYRPIWFALCGLAVLGALTALRIRPPALDPAART